MATQVHEIYGIRYETPEVPPKDEISGSILPTKKQKFYRVVIPDSFSELDYDGAGNAVYNPEQEAFIEQVQHHILHGYWYMNNGVPTYLTGLHYYYLNFWRLENGILPEYRDADRRWFYFQDYCYDKPYIFGIIRLKKRREGATSQACCSLTLRATTMERAFCGIVSKKAPDAKKTFNSMVKNGFKCLPEFLKVRVEDENSKTELRFNQITTRKAKKDKKKGQLYSDSLGLESLIDFQPTDLSSYDSGRLTELLLDEGAKFPKEVPINEYWPIVKKVLMEGAMKVGFALLPSTTNRGENGGTGFRVLWDQSDHTKSQKTGTGLYRYFSPGYDGLEGFIDEYGMSIIDKPTTEQVAWMRRRYKADDEMCELGAREWLKLQRSRITDQAMLRKEILDFPFSEKEAFDFGDESNIYNVSLLSDQKEYLNERRLKYRSIRFYENSDGKVEAADDPNGPWKILYFPKEHERNTYTHKGAMKVPLYKHKYVVSVDPFKSEIKVGKGSLGCAIIWAKMDSLDPENTGMPLAFLHWRPRIKNQLHEQVLLAARYYSGEICYESDIDDYITYIRPLGYMGFVMEKPKNAIDPNQKRKNTTREFGVKAANGFALSAAITASVEYVELYSHKIFFMEILDDLMSYDPDKRTDHDISAAFQIGCLAIQTPVTKRQMQAKQVQFVRTFDLTRQAN